MTVEYSSGVNATRLVALNGYIGGGARLRIYAGARPAHPDVALTTQILLTELVGSTTFGVVTGTKLTSYTLLPGSVGYGISNLAPSFYRLFQADGTTIVMDGDVGSDLLLSASAVSTGDSIAVLSFVINASAALPLSIIGAAGPATNGVAYTTPFSGVGGSFPYAYSIASGALPAGLTLNATTGVLSGTPTANGTSTFIVRVTDGLGATASTGQSIVVTGTSALSISGTAGSGTVGSAYSASFIASNGTTPYVYSVLSGSLPAGLTLNTASGLVSGTPTAAATSTFVIRATDAVAATANSASQSVVIAASGSALAISGTAPAGAVGSAYSYAFTGTGGTAPRTFAVFSGTLPAGLSLSTGGILSGTPTTAASSTFVVRVTDALAVTVDSASQFVTIASSAVAPGAVTGVTAGTPTATTQPLTWTAPTTGTAPITYNIGYRLTSAGGAYTSFATAVSGTNSTVTGLVASTSYDYQVTPVNGVGPGAAGLLANVSTAASGPVLDFLANDGATQQPFLAGSAIYNPATNTTWITRQRAKYDGTRVGAVSVVNHNTSSVASYDAFADLENQDGHGGATMCRLPSGYWQIMGGVHGATYFKYAVTTTPDDPSTFVDQGNILGGSSISLTYPQPLYIDGGLYVFARCGAPLYPSSNPYGYVKASSISSVGVPTFPSTFNAVLEMGAGSRTYGSNIVALPNGYEVAIATCYDDYNDRLGRQNVYVAVLNTRTGMVRNVANTASTAAPALKTWLDANCLVVDQTTAGKFGNIPYLGIDSNGNLFVGYNESNAYNLPPTAQREVHWTGAGWSAPTTLYTSATQGSFNQIAFATLNSGAMTAYLQTDATSGFARGGDMAQATYTPGVGWSSASVIKAAETYGLCNAVTVQNGTAVARMAFGELPFGLGAIEPTIYGGDTRRYLWSDAGLVTRPLVEDAATTAYYTQFASPPSTNSTARKAVNNLVTSLKRLTGVWAGIDFLYLLANQDEQGALINLKGTTTFNATKSGTPTFTVNAGYTGDGAGYVSSNFVASTAPTPAYSLNSAAVGVFSLNNPTVSAAVLVSTLGSGGFYAIPRQTNSYPKIKVNSAAGTQVANTINRTDGLSVYVRTGSNSEGAIPEGTFFGTGDSAVSTAVPTSAMTLFCDNGTTTAPGHQIAIWFAGAHLGFENYQLIGNIFRRYLKAIGVASAVRTERQQLTNSITLASAFFGKGGNLTVTAGRSDPFSGTAAFRLQASATSPTIANTLVTQPAATLDPNIQDTGGSGFYNNNVASMWVRSDTAGQSIMVYDGSAYTAIAVPSTWTRVSWITAQAYHTFQFCSYDGTSNRFSDIDVYGPQLDPGSAPGSYKATTT